VQTCGADLWCRSVMQACGADLLCRLVVRTCGGDLWRSTASLYIFAKSSKKLKQFAVEMLLLPSASYF